MSETSNKKDKEFDNATAVQAEDISRPSMTMTLFFYWVVPVLILAAVSRFGVETVTLPTKPDPRPISLDLGKRAPDTATKRDAKYRKRETPSPTPTSLSKMPTSYQDVVNQISKRRPRWRGAMSSHEEVEIKPAERKPVEAVTDPSHLAMGDAIRKLRADFQANPTDVFKIIGLADALRQKELIHHDGGSGQVEALELYQSAIDLTLEKKKALIEAGEPTNRSLSGTTNVREEIMYDYSQKSVDGLLCSLYTSMGKQYFMANMFERAVEAHNKCIEIEPLYLDAVNSRGSTLIILGRYADAAKDLTTVIENDDNRFFKEAFTGLAKVLAAKEEVVPQGWGPMVTIVEELVSKLEAQYSSTQNAATKRAIADSLNRLYHVMFTYHDVKTNDTDAAWDSLSKSYQHKMSVLPPFNAAYEKQKTLQIKQIFNKNFWPKGVGSSSKAPIFIIGFVRSGSTLLERVLDAHPMIVGTGEDSVFNGKLDHIRNSIVEASMSGSQEALVQTVQAMADDVVDEMRTRWQLIDANTAKSDGDSSITLPERFADKMLTNYFNVGFIHMLFPEALILHVAREPMDTIFSAYKHEFPPGTLDYTSEFSSLAELYHSYRTVMDHWDEVLPGRIMHVRYEDMVHDMPGMAKSIIDATGLPWDEDVLNFHKKKHAVNTLSTTQVRKGVYKHSLQAWRRYEKPLQPLVQLIGDQAKWDLKTTLPTYSPPAQANE